MKIDEMTIESDRWTNALIMRQKPGFRMDREAAEALAVEALGFLASDGERIERFLSLSGLDPTRLRAAAAEPGFLAGVLDHLASDETLLVAFAANTGRAPESIEAARTALAHGGEEAT
jgi:hypothetical protein